MRSKVLKRIINFILAIIMIVIFPLNAYAAEGNGTGDDTDNSGVHYVTGGASYQKAAYLIYIVDKNGNVITPVVEAAIDGCKEPPVDANFDYELSKFGNKAPTSFNTINGVPTPFTSEGDGNGALLKQALLRVTGTGVDGEDIYKASDVIHTMFDGGSGDNCKGFCYKFLNSNEDQYLIFEGVYWLTMNNGSHSGETLVATATGWAKAQEAYGCGEYGSSTFSKYTNNIYPNCMKFEFSQLGYGPCPSGKQTNNTIMSSASGIISVWNNEVRAKTQTTCDESQSAPHKSPEESKGAYSIIKNYVTKKGDVYTDNGCYIKTDVCNSIKIENETKVTGYTLYNWVVTDSYSPVTAVSNNKLVWENNIAGNKKSNGVSTESLDMQSLGGNTLYLLLVKEETQEEKGGDFTISQSSLTKRIRFSESSVTNILNSHSFKWFSEGFAHTSCDGHAYTDSCGTALSPCPGHTDYCSNFDWYDNTITTSLVNDKVGSYNSIMVQIPGWQNVVEDSNKYNITKYWTTFTRGLTGSSVLSRTTWDYVSVLWRGENKLTVAAWKNNDTTNSLMSSIGFSVANNPQGTRKTADYLSEFAANFSEDLGSNREVSTRYGAYTASSTGAICIDTKDYSFIEGSSLSIGSIKALVKVYSGESSVSATNTDLKKNQAVAGSVSFYPYIQMKYDKYATAYEQNYSQTAFVLGNYERKIDLKNYCLVTFPKDTNNSLEVISQQWSTHATTTDSLNKLLGEDSVKKIIPGGATLSLENSMGTKGYNSKDVTVQTYQCIVEGAGKTQIDYTGSINGDLTEDTAKSNHEATADEVVDSLSKLRIELWGNKDAKNDPFKGENVTVSGKFNNATLSNDSKYNWNSFSELYLNAEKDSTTYSKYVFSADTAGNILMNGNIILTRSQNVKDLKDSTAVEINNRTDIVNQLCNGLERNSGDDKSAIWSMSDGHWYNEAFDGITVLVSTTKVHVGLWNTSSRQTVFDTKLTPNQSSSEDMGTKFYSFQMRTASSTDKFSGDNNRIGSFMGVNVYTAVDLKTLYISDRFYSTNMTTQDLK